MLPISTESRASITNSNCPAPQENPSARILRRGKDTRLALRGRALPAIDRVRDVRRREEPKRRSGFGSALAKRVAYALSGSARPRLIAAKRERCGDHEEPPLPTPPSTHPAPPSFPFRRRYTSRPVATIQPKLSRPRCDTKATKGRPPFEQSSSLRAREQMTPLSSPEPAKRTNEGSCISRQLVRVSIFWNYSIIPSVECKNRLYS